MKASALEMNLMGERSTWSETEQHKNDPKTVHRRRGWLLHVSWVLAVWVVLSLVGIIVGLTSVQSKLDHAQPPPEPEPEPEPELPCCTSASNRITSSSHMLKSFLGHHTMRCRSMVWSA